MMSKSHYYSEIEVSPWPLVNTISGFNFLFSLSLLLKFNLSKWFLFNCTILLFCFLLWWFWMSSEMNLEGLFSLNTESGLKLSMILFISSEVFFFFSFFWSYFHYFLSPCMEIGLSWPPQQVEMFNCSNVPFLNTILLVSSGATVTAAHHFLLSKKMSLFNFYLGVTIILGCLFSFLQMSEYLSSFFTISDSVFGTSFFMLTGFHGIHVFIGTIFLVISLTFSISLKSGDKEFLSFELASWYWHFVDVVWLFLFFCLYYLNN